MSTALSRVYEQSVRKVKLSLYLIKNSAMKTYWEVEVGLCEGSVGSHQYKSCPAVRQITDTEKGT